MNLNEKLFKFINGQVHKSILIDSLMIFSSKYLPYIFIGILVILYIYGVIKRKEDIRCIVADTFVITVINLMLSYFIGILYYVPRPFVTKKVNLLIPHVKDASFPSDHAIGTMSIALGIDKYNKIYSIMMIMLSFLVGISRIYVGHHYPLDVIGGYLIVLITKYLYQMIVEKRIQNIYLKAESIFLDWGPVSNIIRKGYDIK